MQTRFFILVCFFFLISNQKALSQFGFSHEIGVITGPVAFYSDYGVRNDFETNSGNTGFGVGLIHYLNFAYRSDCNCYTRDSYFNDHFKLRNEISYNRTELQHLGKWVDPNRDSDFARYLRSIRASTSVIDIGSQLEYFPFSIRDFSASRGAFAPFLSLGVHYVSFDPEASTTDGSPLENVLFPKYLGAYQQEASSTWSIVTSVGVRYKLSPLSDLMLDARWQYYFSDWVDGLNPTFENNGNRIQVPENKANDWLFWLNFGYIYYLE